MQVVGPQDESIFLKGDVTEHDAFATTDSVEAGPLRIECVVVAVEDHVGVGEDEGLHNQGIRRLGPDSDESLPFAAAA